MNGRGNNEKGSRAQDPVAAAAKLVNATNIMLFSELRAVSSAIYTLMELTQ